MKVQLLQDSLSKALGLASHVVSSKPNLPILGNIYLEAEKDKLIISGTDLDVGVRLSIKAEVFESGSIAVPSRLFADFISSITSGKITLETEGLILKSKSGIYSSSFNCLDGDEFPPFPEKGKEVEIDFEAKYFKEALSKILFSASTDLSRQILTGVLFEFQKKQVTLATTDGFRLSSFLLNGSYDNLNDFIIPARGLQELIKSGGVEDDEKKGVKISLSENKNQIVIENGVIEIALRLLEGKFPDYKKIIPSKFISVLTVNREEILKAVKVASIFARDNANIVHFALKIKDQSLSVSASAREMGEGSSILKGAVSGEDLMISFNSRFLLEVMNVFTSSELKLDFSGALKPIKITENGNENFFHVLMPVRTGN